MRIAEILQAFHTMPACDRLDLICRMLRYCVPHELTFLGTVNCDLVKQDYQSLIKTLEVNANRVSYFSGFQDTGVTHEVCEKLCGALSVIHANNHPVAEAVFNLLSDKRVLRFFEETTDLKVLEDFRLLYVMAVNHPVFSFNQRLHLMYTFLHRMDAVFSEKCRATFSGSFSFSSGSGEQRNGEGELARYPPEGTIKDPAPDAYLTRCELSSVYKRSSDRRYVYMIQVEWSDGTLYTVRRTYGDFFSFQNKLLDLFPEEGGHKHKKLRVIPFLPGKKLLNKSNRELAERRLPELAKYTRELIALPEHITRSSHVMEFFKPRPPDYKEEYPSPHKVTTLYDLLESGKTRHPSAPPILIKSTHSPTASPIPIRVSPLHRLVGLGGESPTHSPSQGTRTSHTLPHSIPTSVQQPKGQESPLERRFTYPSRRSAFIPVVPTTENQSASSSSNLVSTASQPSIVASTSGSQSSVGTSNSPTLATANHTLATGTPTAMTTSHPHADSIYHPTLANHTTPSLPRHSGASPIIPRASSSIAVTSTGLHPVLQSSQAVVIASTPNSSLVYSKTTDAKVATTVSNSAVPTAKHVMHTTPSAHAIYAPQFFVTTVASTNTTSVTSAAARTTSVMTSPTTCVTSPLLSTAISQSRASITTPSPPHSGTTTPKGTPFSPSLSQLIPFGNLGVPRYVGSMSPVAAFHPYVYGSPLASPIPSPKTPKMNLHASYQNVTRTPTEFDSLTRWLKSHRLHKYTSLFENMTFDELCGLSEELLKSKGMTAGAAKKLRVKVDELRRANFTGFRDMPFSSGMTRKASTCSLPAALLMERGMTPSSSFEGLSPAESTCSLDIKPMQGVTTPVHKRPVSVSASVTATVGDHHRSKSEGVNISVGAEVPPVIASVDTAIVKAVPAKVNGDVGMGSLSMGCGASGGIESRRSTGSSSSKESTPSAANTPKVQNRHSASHTHNISNASRTSSFGNAEGVSATGNSSWADQVVPAEEIVLVNRPEWAQMSSNGELHARPPRYGDLHHNAALFNAPGRTSPFHQLLTTQPFQTQPQLRHTHVPVSKRHSGETYNASVIQVPGTPKQNSYSDNPPILSVPPPLLPGGPTAAGIPPRIPMNVNAANWPRPVLLPNSVSLARTTRSHVQTLPFIPYTTAAMNGLLPASPQVGVNRLPAPQPMLPSFHHHVRSSKPVTCFNCGKRGHLGNACPGETMETNNPQAFHKQLEKLVASNKPRGHPQETIK